MATSTTKPTVHDLAGRFDAAADRVRALNEQAVATAKKAGNASVDTYEKAVSSYVGFQHLWAGTSQVDWVSSTIKAQADFVSEVTAAYTSAARDLLK